MGKSTPCMERGILGSREGIRLLNWSFAEQPAIRRRARILTVLINSRGSPSFSTKRRKSQVDEEAPEQEADHATDNTEWNNDLVRIAPTRHRLKIKQDRSHRNADGKKGNTTCNRRDSTQQERCYKKNELAFWEMQSDFVQHVGSSPHRSREGAPQRKNRGQ